MTGTDRIEMRIHDLEDKLSGVQYSHTIIERQLESLSKTVLILDSKIREISESIEGDNK